MRMRQIVLTILSFVVVTAGLRGAAEATPLPLNGHWTTLDQDMAAPGFFTGDWSWTSSDTVRVNITDFLVVGDGFEVYDNGSPVAQFFGKPDWTGIGGPCAGPFSAACGWTADPGTAFTNSLFNQGSLFFAPGSHDLTIQSLSIPTTGPNTFFPDSTVAFSADVAPVPEPASLLLLGTGLFAGALGARRLRRKSGTAQV